MTSRALVSRKGRRTLWEGRKRGRRVGGTCHNDKPGQGKGDGGGMERSLEEVEGRRVGEEAGPATKRCKRKEEGGTCHNDKPGRRKSRMGEMCAIWRDVPQ